MTGGQAYRDGCSRRNNFGSDGTDGWNLTQDLRREVFSALREADSGAPLGVTVAVCPVAGRNTRPHRRTPVSVILFNQTSRWLGA